VNKSHREHLDHTGDRQHPLQNRPQSPTTWRSCPAATPSGSPATTPTRPSYVVRRMYLR